MFRDFERKEIDPKYSVDNNTIDIPITLLSIDVQKSIRTFLSFLKASHISKVSGSSVYSLHSLFQMPCNHSTEIKSWESELKRKKY